MMTDLFLAKCTVWIYFRTTEILGHAKKNPLLFVSGAAPVKLFMTSTILR